VEQQLAPWLAEWQVTQLIDGDEIIAQQFLGEPAGAAGGLLLLKLIDEIDQVEEATLRAGANDRRGDADAQMRFAGAGRSSVIVPSVWDQKCGSRIRIIHDAARRWRCWEASGMRAQATSLFASLTGRCLCSRVG
jgi:hypothetical protein